MEQLHGIIITKEQALTIISRHGNTDELIDFFETFKNKHTYKATDIFSWLGY